MLNEGTIMFSNPESAIVNGILLVGIVFALMMARWVGKLNKEQHAKNRAFKSMLHKA